MVTMTKPRRLRISIGGYLGTSYSVRLEREVLRYVSSGNGYTTAEIKPEIASYDGSYSGRGIPTAAMMSRVRLVISRR